MRLPAIDDESFIGKPPRDCDPHPGSAMTPGSACLFATLRLIPTQLTVIDFDTNLGPTAPRPAANASGFLLVSLAKTPPINHMSRRFRTKASNKPPANGGTGKES